MPLSQSKCVRNVEAAMATRSFRRSIGAGILAIGLSIGSTGLATANTPPDGATIARRIMAAKDPAAALAALSSAERNAYIQAGTVTSTVSVLHQPVAVAPPAGSTAPMSGGCWNWTWEVDGHSTGGFVVFRYFQDMGWCSNGATITSLTWHNRHGEVDFFGWNWSQVPTDWPTYGGVGYSTWRSFTQATFSFCLPVCAQYRYPWLDMTAHANGTGTGSVGGAD
jgi:hypothetical protein